MPVRVERAFMWLKQGQGCQRLYLHDCLEPLPLRLVVHLDCVHPNATGRFEIDTQVVQESYSLRRDIHIHVHAAAAAGRRRAARDSCDSASL